MARRVVVSWALALAFAPVANAQTGSSGTSTGQSSPDPQAQSSTATAETRPATTTFYGDTGLWFVPTAEVLPDRQVAVSGYRRGTNYIQGYTNVGDFAGTFAVGVKHRAEIFGSFLFVTRIDRDTRPIFNPDPSFGGVVDRYPRVTTGWTGNHVGDFYVGGKVNFWSQADQKPVALAVRGIVKLPTGDKDVGAGTGKVDFLADFIVSKETPTHAAEVAGYAGFIARGSADGFDSPSGGFRWGVGGAFPSRAPLRFIAELNGETGSGNTTLTAPPLVGVDGSVAPLVSNGENLSRLTFGVTYQAPKGVFVGAGLSWNFPTQGRNLAVASDDPTGDYWDWQVRIGYHPGVRVYVPPPPPPPPEAPPAPQNRPPTVTAVCDPMTVEVGKSSTCTATGRDPDGDPLTYRWTAPTGTLATPAEQRTLWTAPGQEGPVPITVTVSDGKGGTASATVTVQVVRPPRKEYTFEDVHFDFDRYTLRPEATRVLDEAIAAMREDPTLRLTIEGHTCNIGTAEYNLALGERRANAVKDYLVTRGVAADRLQTVSYGEERPKYDNAREETRRLNRRAALVVRLQ
jgi:peptidoglycan-associated lipoprotein